MAPLLRVGNREFVKIEWPSVIESLFAFLGGLIINGRDLIALLIGFFVRRALG